MWNCCQCRMKDPEVSPWGLEQVGSVNERKTAQPFLGGEKPGAASHFHSPGKPTPGNVWCVQDWNKFGFVETKEEGNGGNFRWYLWRNGLRAGERRLWRFSLQREQGGVNKVLICQGYRSLLRGTGASILKTHILNKIHSCSMLRFYFLENCSYISLLKQVFLKFMCLSIHRFKDKQMNKIQIGPF